VKSNKLPVVSYLLTKDKSLVEATDKVGNFTPLYRAAQKGLLDMAKLLVKKGADIESTKGDGSTPFYIGT
jgi:ankyrin repeat protein